MRAQQIHARMTFVYLFFHRDSFSFACQKPVYWLHRNCLEKLNGVAVTFNEDIISMLLLKSSKGPIKIIQIPETGHLFYINAHRTRKERI